MSCDIKIENMNKRYGFLQGTVNQYLFYAEVMKVPVAGGIDLLSMQKGQGHITKLCIYDDEVDSGGDPFLPTMSIKRHIYVNYEGEWKVYNFTFQSLVFELVHYLDRRCHMTIVR
ncbi:MAG: hypothetical protein AVO33_08720 [delta proteobacterium ML8_F1]|nr:MAG: hypothetical protein AVO33_08720 [delta proteobacterium ML8_F1]